MSLHINQFLDRLKAADARQQRDFVMSMADARNLHSDITKLLLAVQTLQDAAQQGNTADTENTVVFDGGSF
jgi:hypothetical protein